MAIGACCLLAESFEEFILRGIKEGECSGHCFSMSAMISLLNSALNKEIICAESYTNIEYSWKFQIFLPPSNY